MDPLEKRLRQLKDSYEEIPTINKASQIMDRIQKTELQKKRKGWKTQLPYVASFMGVLLIGGILVVQLLASPESSPSPGDSPNTEEESSNVEPNEKVTAEEIAKKHEELEAYYNEQKLAFEKIEFISISNAEEIEHILKAKTLVEQSASLDPKNFEDSTDLEKTFSDLKSIVQDSFELPKQDFQQINENTDFLIIMEKQENFLSYLDEQLRNYSVEFSQKLSQDFFEGLDMLNQLNVKDPEIRAFAEEVIQNGYIFINSGGEGQYGTRINYQYYLNEFGTMLDPVVKEFAELMIKRTAMDGAIIPTWEELGNRLIQLEELKNSYEGSSSVINDAYQFDLNLYLNGADSSRAFINGKLDPELQKSYEYILANHKDTETYTIVKEYYDLLEKGNFKEEAVADYNK
ncbi:hypothetical protein [Bacillus pinisoli]|uniref:hypothetical protein n=1 Tax=Bacillus pinisoli TaxID=2901866 RepID=UPI001FF1FDD1|nr:hypothetical protein [Bacillus pinisoli]